jgi:hypothetical protein
LNIEDIIGCSTKQGSSTLEQDERQLHHWCNKHHLEWTVHIPPNCCLGNERKEDQKPNFSIINKVSSATHFPSLKYEANVVLTRTPGQDFLPRRLLNDEVDCTNCTTAGYGDEIYCIVNEDEENQSDMGDNNVDIVDDATNTVNPGLLILEGKDCHMVAANNEGPGYHNVKKAEGEGN